MQHGLIIEFCLQFVNPLLHVVQPGLSIDNISLSLLGPVKKVEKRIKNKKYYYCLVKNVFSYLMPGTLRVG